MKLNARNIKALLILTFAVIWLIPATTTAREKPSCVFLKFTDDTRYDQLNTAEKISEMVALRMYAAKDRFRFPTKDIVDAHLEARLYDEKIDELTRFDAAINSGDYNKFFEGDGFNEKKAQSIVTAQVGQYITPEITAEIGRIHNAEYLIQGTIINLGTGSWLSEDLEFVSGAISNVAKVASSQASNLFGKSLSALKFLGEMGEVSVTIKGIGVQCDVRVIKASTGEVVWSKRVVGKGQSKFLEIASIKFGHEKLSDALYNKALNDAADKIVKAMIADMDANKLFLK